MLPERISLSGKRSLQAEDISSLHLHYPNCAGCAISSQVAARYENNPESTLNCISR